MHRLSTRLPGICDQPEPDYQESIVISYFVRTPTRHAEIELKAACRILFQLTTESCKSCYTFFSNFERGLRVWMKVLSNRLKVWPLRHWVIDKNFPLLSVHLDGGEKNRYPCVPSRGFSKKFKVQTFKHWLLLHVRSFQPVAPRWKSK